MDSMYKAVVNAQKALDEASVPKTNRVVRLTRKQFDLYKKEAQSLSPNYKFEIVE